MKAKKKKKRHVLGEGWTRYSGTDSLDEFTTVRLVAEKEYRGWQEPLPLKLQRWDKKVRLVLEEI